MPKDKSLKRKRNRGQSIISYNKQDFFNYSDHKRKEKEEESRRC
tara:strand:- start:409 stop:540 length:132 start_codon:yes stop_codon:yes gene_type:complete